MESTGVVVVPLTAQGLSPGVQKFIPLGAKGHIPADRRALPHSPPSSSGYKRSRWSQAQTSPTICARGAVSLRLAADASRSTALGDPGPLRGRAGSHMARWHAWCSTTLGASFSRRKM